MLIILILNETEASALCYRNQDHQHRNYSSYGKTKAFFMKLLPAAKHAINPHSKNILTI